MPLEWYLAIFSTSSARMRGLLWLSSSAFFGVSAGSGLFVYTRLRMARVGSTGPSGVPSKLLSSMTRVISSGSSFVELVRGLGYLSSPFYSAPTGLRRFGVLSVMLSVFCVFVLRVAAFLRLGLCVLCVVLFLRSVNLLMCFLLLFLTLWVFL